MTEKHISLPKPFTGGDIAEWLQRFDICCEANAWDGDIFNGDFLMHIHVYVLMLCRNFELIPIKIGFFTIIKICFKTWSKNIVL